MFWHVELRVPWPFTPTPTHPHQSPGAWGHPQRVGHCTTHLPALCSGLLFQITITSGDKSQGFVSKVMPLRSMNFPPDTR